MSNEKALGRIILMTNINTFSKIILDNLAHIVHVPHPSTIPPVQKKEHKHGLIDDFRQIGDLKLEKKYNLIYAGTGFDLNYDPLYSRKARTDAVVKVVMNNPDKIFMIIDNDRLNWQILNRISRYTRTRNIGFVHVWDVLMSLGQGGSIGSTTTTCYRKIK